jgi:hypothetical protein
MKIEHHFTEPVTAVLTACNRPGLLERTLDSFLARNTYPHVARVLVVEDGGVPGTNDRLKGKYAGAVEWLENETRLGLPGPIDRAYALVETPYIFHCEDDWEFYEGGFVEASLAVLRADPRALMVWLRAHDDTMGHPIDPDFAGTAEAAPGHEVRYRRMALDHGGWHGFSFNPGLRRLADYRAHFPEGYGRRVGSDWESPNQPEAMIGEVYRSLGYYAAILDAPAGFVRHIGWGHSVPKRAVGQ